MAAPAATANAIKTGALRKLGVLAADETAAAADDKLIGDALDRMIDAAGRDGDMNFYRDQIPDDAGEGLIVMLAAAVAEDFGYPASGIPALEAKASIERGKFRKDASIGATENAVTFVNY